MTAPRTAVATQDPLAAQRAAHIAEIRERNAHAAAIRGLSWGKELNGMTVSAVAHYCTMHGLDPARHVEVLGGRIYLTGELYAEKGAPLLLSGRVVLDAPAFVHADAALDELIADTTDPDMAAWARAEKNTRTKARILHGIPHDATGACVYRGTIPGGTVIVGFNWCGGATKVKRRKNPRPGEAGEYRGDPVGDSEPVKTAQSRAARRFWRQVVVALPEYGAEMGRIEAGAVTANATMAVEASPVAAIKAGTPSHPTPLVSVGDEPYGAAEPRTADEENFEIGLDKD